MANADWAGLLNSLGGFYRDIEVAKASADGSPTGGARAETVADQTAASTGNISGPGGFGGGNATPWILGGLLIVGAVAAFAIVKS